MKPLRPALFFLVALACFDPLYELGPGRSWAVCCRQGSLDTCECLDENTCGFSLTACSGDRCVPPGNSCFGGSGGSGTGGGHSGNGGNAGSGTGGTGGSAGGGAIQDGGASFDSGVPDAGVPDSGAPPDAGQQPMPDAGPPITFYTYEPCCSSGRVSSCACPNGQCSSPPFKPCSMGRCVAPGATCP